MTVAQGYVDGPIGALMFDELEDYEALIGGLSEYIANEESVGVAYHNRALAYWEIGKIEEALRDFGEAETRLPQHYMPSQVKGMLLEKLGRQEEALTALDRAVSIGPNEVTARRTRALLLVSMGRLKDSLDDFNHAIQLAPSFQRTIQDRDKVLSQLNCPRVLTDKKWWQVWK